MKHKILLCAILTPCTLSALDASPAQEAPTAIQGESVCETESTYLEMLSILNEIEQTLLSIHDKTSADGAAKQLQKINDKIIIAQTKMGELPPPSAEAEHQLQQKYHEKLQSSASKIKSITLAIQQANYYHSEALEAVFTSNN